MRLHHIYISPGHNFFGHHGLRPDEHQMLEVEEVKCVAGSGLAGDRFFDFKPDYKGQATLFSLEIHERLQAEFGKTYSPSAYRRNLMVSGVDLNELIGKEFELDGIRFLGTQEAAPCYWMDQAIADGAEKSMRGNGGLRVKILSDGILHPEAVGVDA
ncbi:MAG: MOSC domain-containing protein YiiM [Verrucomicrobiales bacterium]|jgi:MOSC domain-containing protein YiiM